MNEWYFARGGQQMGPVSLEKLVEMAGKGELASSDLVWTSTMSDWKPAGQVEGIFSVSPGSLASAPAPVVAPPSDPSNPYSAPQSTWNEPVVAQVGALAEIVSGSDPLDAVVCIKRGFELTVRQLGNILLVGLVYFALVFGANMVLGMIQFVSGASGAQGAQHFQDMNGMHVTVSHGATGAQIAINLVSQIALWIFNLYIGMGLTRVGFNLVSGKEVNVGQLFGEGHKLLRAAGASILFGLMVGIGILLLIVPGVYLALRYGQYMKAIVDRDLGVMDSLAYSSAITTNNRLNLFLLALLSIVVTIAGVAAFCVGIFFALPIVWLAGIVAYRWMQYGHRAAMDQPGTKIPMLAAQ